MGNTAKVFMTGRSQAVRLPKEFRFESDEVRIRKEAMQSFSSPFRGTGRGWMASYARLTRTFSRPSGADAATGRAGPAPAGSGAWPGFTTGR